MKAFKSILNAIIKIANNLLPAKWRIPKVSPSLITWGPEHVNCRCVFAPLISDEEAGDVVE